MAEAVVIAEALQGLGFRMMKEIFDNQSKFFDVEVYNKSRAQIYEELASLAANVRMAFPNPFLVFEIHVLQIGVPKELFLEQTLLDVSNGQKNSGNAATRVLKMYVRQHRQLGIHATPSLRVNGIVIDCTSSWTLAVSCIAF
jgi:phosphoribosylformylglycinamidine (FGAM) synthase PurS component